MEILFLVVTNICATAFYILGALHLVHMFQLNSYKPKVQLKWMKTMPRLLPFILVLVGTVCAVFMETPVREIIVIVLLAAGCIAERPRKAKIALKYTARVKRLLITLFLFIAAAVLADIFTDLPILFTGAICGLLPAVILLANLINRPAEKLVSRYYINDAKRMLRECPDLIVIGVTGSFGKTSVKYFLGTLLKAKYNVLITPESYNTPLGVVRTIRSSLKATHNMFICEMGARNSGDIAELCELVKPVHGVITSIGEQHLESFKSIDNIIKTKFELEAALPADGTIFLNGDNEYIASKKLGANRRRVTYGLKAGNDYRASDIRVSERGSIFTVTAADGSSGEFTTKLIGEHNVINITGAIAVANTFGIAFEQLAPQVRKLEGVPHRLQLIRRGDITIIDDAYNSNPSGAKAALDTMAMMDGCRILVTPGMVELGARQSELNMEFGREAAAVCDYIITVGREQTEPIIKGVLEAGFSAESLFVVDSLKEALEKAYSTSVDRNKIILLENDLPDNY